mmetsp:Transcript_26512/g.48087  ORF Transcript_26512/g.48087 Transcript_26512/m.48087 type:complete len:907 (-) Transcript_26512:248-2968(-)
MIMRGIVCYSFVAHAASLTGLMWLIILQRMTCLAHNIDTERLLRNTKSAKKKHGGLIFDKQGKDRSRILQFFEAPGATRKRDRISRKKRRRKKRRNPKRGPRPDSSIQYQYPPTEDPIASPSITRTKEVASPRAPRVSRAPRYPRAPRGRHRARNSVPNPTVMPTRPPSKPPSNAPIFTDSPVEAPTISATNSPTIHPNNESTKVPTTDVLVTEFPTRLLTDTPTDIPTELPTTPPSNAPGSTNVPTDASSDGPTDSPPTSNRTDAPTEVPTSITTGVPTEVPTIFPTDVRTSFPTNTPTELPTDVPTEVPTDISTDTDTPTETPAKPPSNAPFSTDPPTTAPIFRNPFQARSNEVEIFVGVVLERSNATVTDFSSVDIDSLLIIVPDDDISPFDSYFEDVSAINQIHKDTIETDQKLFIEQTEMFTNKDVEDFIQSTNVMIEAVEKTFQDQICCFVSNLKEKIELPDDIRVFTQMLEVELNRVFLEVGVDVLLEEITIKNQGWLKASKIIEVDLQGTQTGKSHALNGGLEQPIDKHLLALTLNANYKCGGYCVSSQEVGAAISDRLNSRLQPLSQYLLSNYAGNNTSGPPLGNISISCHPCGGWNWADGFSKFIRTHMPIPGTKKCTKDDLILNENSSEKQEERKRACEYKLKMLPLVMAQYEMRTEESRNEVKSWTAETPRDIVTAATFRRTLELLEIWENMKWVWDQNIASVWDQNVSSVPFNYLGDTPVGVIEMEILYLGKEAFNDIECEINGLTNETHSQSDSLKLAELFVAIFDNALLFGEEDVTISELYVTDDCLIEDGECIEESSTRRLQLRRRRQKRRLRFKGGVTCRVCRTKTKIVADSYYCPDSGCSTPLTIWEKFVNNRYAISIMENLGHLVEGNSKVEVRCKYTSNHGILNFW